MERIAAAMIDDTPPVAITFTTVGYGDLSPGNDASRAGAVAEAIRPELGMLVIGIGAGPATDGQVLVFHDLLGIREGRGARFVQRYADLLDEIGYRAVVIAFPLLTIMIILGAIWADIAWGRYWSWDPKETAALVTWLIYGAYLHARVVRDWRGSKAAWLLILGFAAILFTYFGNLFFGGLHSYA